MCKPDLRNDAVAAKRCVVIGGADISDTCYERIQGFIADDDFCAFCVFCDSGLKHLPRLQALNPQIVPNMIVGDFDSHENPHMDVETIVLPCEKDDTDTVFAVKEAVKRGYMDFVLIGVAGGRLDHTLGNLSILLYLDSLGANAVMIDDYSEMQIISPGTCEALSTCGPRTTCEAQTTCEAPTNTDPGESCTSGSGCFTSGRLASNRLISDRFVAEIPDSYAYFSLIAVAGPASGINITGAKYPLINGTITPEYQYGISNEVLPGQTARVTVEDGKLLLIKVL